MSRITFPLATTLAVSLFAGLPLMAAETYEVEKDASVVIERDGETEHIKRQRHERHQRKDRVHRKNFRASVERDGETVKELHGHERVVRDGDGHTDRRRKVVIERPDQKKEVRRRHDVIDVEKEGDTKTWHRETDIRSNRKGRSTIVADGIKEKTEDGGQSSVQRSGERTSKDGDTSNWSEDANRRWQRNASGGLDSEKERNRTRADGESVSERAQRRRVKKEDGSVDFVGQFERSGPKGDSIHWEKGTETRKDTANGYILTRETKGWDKRTSWERRFVKEVTRGSDGSMSVTETTRLSEKGRSGSATTTVREGTYTPVAKGSGYRYVGTVEQRRGRKVLERRDIERECRRLPSDGKMAKDKGNKKAKR